MEYKKIINLLENKPNQPSNFTKIDTQIDNAKDIVIECQCAV